MIRCLKYKTWLFCLCLYPCFLPGPVAAGGGPADDRPSLLTVAYNHAVSIAPMHDTAFVSEEKGPSAESASGSQTYFVNDPALYGKENVVSLQRDAIGAWREHVFAKLGGYSRTATGFGNGPQSRNESEDQTSDERKIKRMASEETLKFIQKSSPIIDKMVLYLKWEISNNTYKEAVGVQASDKSTLPLKDEPFKKKGTDNGPALNAGIGLKLGDGGAGLTGKTEVRYGKLSSFYKMNMDKHNDSGLGLKYPYDSNLYLLLSHENTHTSDPLTGNKVTDMTRSNLITFNLRF
jgi:hypothetical protein